MQCLMCSNKALFTKQGAFGPQAGVCQPILSDISLFMSKVKTKSHLEAGVCHYENKC